MASVWAIYDNSAEPILLGYFSSQEKAEAFVHPSLIGTDAYTLEEVLLDDAPFKPGEIYGPVYWASINLESGEDISSDRTPAYCVRREEDWSGQSVDVRRSGSIAFGRSAVSYEAALSNARHAREEHLASGKPTRLRFEHVYLEGNIFPYDFGDQGRVREVRSDLDRFQIPVLLPSSVSISWGTTHNKPTFGNLAFDRTDRRTPGGMPIFELAKEATSTTE